MFGRSRRRIAELEETNAWLESRVRQLNLALGATRNESAIAFGRSERFADDVMAAQKKLTAARIENAGLVFRVEDWAQAAVGNAERLGRALRACVRYRAEIQRLRRELRFARRDFAERQIALEDRLRDLQAANEGHYRASAAAVPASPIAA
jgi:chromosome segregation ATPase